LADDQTRISIGRINGGSARNAVPASLYLEGELRSFEPFEARKHYIEAIREAFENAARRFGGSVEVTFDAHCMNYGVGEDEPLLKVYREVLATRGAELRMRPTFIGS